MSYQLELSLVAILTYNEQSNIEACIDSVKKCGFHKVIVYDGGSTDDTLNIVRQKNIEYIEEKGSSISQRRSMGVEQSIREGFRYVFFVDADQRLLDVQTQEKVDLLFDKNPLLAGVQLNLIAPPDSKQFNYWQLGFYSRHKLITATFTNKSVIGTPCFFKTEIVKNFKYNSGDINGPSDDTFFCKQITSNGFILLSTDIKCTEIVRASMKSTLKKAYWYGIGDAEYIINEPNKKNKRNHLYHVLVRNPIVNPLRNLNKFFFFYLLFGSSRAVGFLYYYIFRPTSYLTKS